ncbi:MAG: hypothetical protein ACREMY_13595 [bacterium]
MDSSQWSGSKVQREFVFQEGWQAARNCVVALLQMAGVSARGDLIPRSWVVAQFEVRCLGRTGSGRRQVLTDGYVRAMCTLHEGGYGFDPRLSRKALQMELSQVERLIEDAKEVETVLRWAKKPKRVKHRKN